MIDARIVANPASLRPGGMGPASGEVWLDLGAVAFPARGWTDFVVVVLVAWANALLRLRHGTDTSARVHFMEGPYDVELARAEGDALELHAIERGRAATARELVPAAPLIASLLAAAEGILAACRERELWSVDADRLEALLPELRRATLDRPG